MAGGMAMPASDAPTSRNKSKALMEISQYEMQSKDVSISMRIRKRNIDGKDVVLATCNEYGCPMGTIPQEYSSKEKFKQAITAKIDAVYEAFK